MNNLVNLRAGLMLGACLSIILPFTAHAAPGDRVGTEFRVNSQTEGRQEPLAVLPTADGFVVAYDTAPSHVYVRRYDIHGTPQGPAFKLNADLYVSAVAAQPQGGFIVAGIDYQSLLAPKVKLQRLDALGNPLGAVSNVDSIGSGAVGSVKLASDAAGNFIVVWESEGQIYVPGPVSSALDPLIDLTLGAIRGRLYKANGSARGLSFRIGTTLGLYNLESFARDPAVVMDDDGSFLVAWVQSLGQQSDIRTQRYSALGLASGLAQKLAAGHSPAVAVRGGQAVVAWQSYDAIPTNDVYLQRLDAKGKPTGSALRANTHLPDEQTLPGVTIDGNGNVVVAWQSGAGPVVDHGSSAGSQDGNGYGVFARRWPASGAPGAEFQVNTYTDQHQRQPLLAAGRGQLLITWSSGHGKIGAPLPQDGSQTGVYAQLFEGP